MLRKILLSSAALAALTSASLAADLPSRKAPPMAPYIPPPVFTWTGGYLGLEVGGGFTNDRGVASIPAFPIFGSGFNRLRDTSVFGGGFAGYNYQMGQVVLGIEGDIEGTGIRARSNRFQFGPFNIAGGRETQEIPVQGSLRGRLGYAVGNALFYVTGGLAVADFRTRYTTTFNAFPVFANGASDTFNNTQVGWTGGGGIEYAFNPNWTIRAEYRYAQFGRYDNRPTTVGNGFYNGAFFAGIGSERIRHNRPDESVARLGIAYKFSAPSAPVVAKY